VLRLGRYEWKSIKNWRFRRNGVGLDQNVTILSVRKPDKWTFMWYTNFGSRLFRFATKHAFYRQTDRQTDRQKGDSSTMRMHSQSYGNKKTKREGNVEMQHGLSAPTSVLNQSLFPCPFYQIRIEYTLKISMPLTWQSWTEVIRTSPCFAISRCRSTPLITN